MQLEPSGFDSLSFGENGPLVALLLAPRFLRGRDWEFGNRMSSVGSVDDTVTGGSWTRTCDKPTWLEDQTSGDRTPPESPARACDP